MDGLAGYICLFLLASILFHVLLGFVLFSLDKFVVFVMASIVRYYRILFIYSTYTYAYTNIYSYMYVHTDIVPLLCFAVAV